jgi:hypothetical protein
LVAGQAYLFNAGSLLHRDGDRLRGKPALLSSLRTIVQETGASLGLYVQEFAIHPKAFAAVAVLCNENPDIFTYGFAASVNGCCYSAIPQLDALAPIGPDERVNTGLVFQQYAGYADSGNPWWWDCYLALGSWFESWFESVIVVRG